MNRLGKYYGYDINAPIYELSTQLSAFYQDITCVETLMIICFVEMGISEIDCRNYATDYINFVGVNNLTQRDYDYAVSVGLI